MSYPSLELTRAPGPVPRMLARAGGHLRVIAHLRRRAEIAVVERLDPGVSVDTLPVMALVALFLSLLPSRRA
jgi:hypothetical protein